MWIERDIAPLLAEQRGTYIQVLVGPRQCGKSSLFAQVSGKRFEEITLDDFQMRRLAEADPALFMAQHPLPLIIDEIQYAPNLFPELKRTVDQLKRAHVSTQAGLTSQVLVRLTGSNQILMDKQVKESLVGRASYFFLNTLSVHEIMRAFPKATVGRILFTGGWPELYVNPDLSLQQYLNDYIRSFLEKDVVLSAGITKQREFHTILGLLAARTGGFLNCTSLAQDSGVKSVTIKEWVSVLERMGLLYLLYPDEPNENKRLVKSPKLYFLDTGLAARLQGWPLLAPLMNSPQIGPLFETLVLAEIVKFQQNYGRDWKISVWRTRDGEEIDFVIENEQNQLLVLDAKLGIHSVSPQAIPRSFLKKGGANTLLVLVSFGGKKMQLSSQCLQLPLTQLPEFLTEF